MTDNPNLIWLHIFQNGAIIMIYNNPNLDLVNINAYKKFGKILSFCSLDMEQKRNSERNSDINQGP